MVLVFIFRSIKLFLYIFDLYAFCCLHLENQIHKIPWDFEIKRII